MRRARCGRAGHGIAAAFASASERSIPCQTSRAFPGGLVAAQIGTAVGVNSWSRVFFDALERRDAAAAWHIATWLPLLVAVSALTVSALVISRMLLQMRWREYLTRRLAGWWIADQRYYRLQFVAKEQAAPEYRIAEDVRLAIEPLVEFAIGLISAAVTAATFAAILWHVAGSARFTLGGRRSSFPATWRWPRSATPPSPRWRPMSRGGRWWRGSPPRTRRKPSFVPR
ncbi:MAG: hypothetical protein B7Z14_00560 [Bosea sp. 32-68-6]|nr:MAG: hypothetical protein B7Z14_00560 [Bosea sp. 32-68-6]